MNKHLPPENVKEIGTINPNLVLEDGVSMCGRCVWGSRVGYITKVTRDTYTISWRDGTTTHLRPDDEETDVQEERCSNADYQRDHTHDYLKRARAE
jgi:hypothetical protein